MLARKPLDGTVAENVLTWGVGALNIDGCRIPTDPRIDDPRLGGAGSWKTTKEQGGHTVSLPRGEVASSPLGRWPANVVHDGSDEVLAAFPDAPGQLARESSSSGSRKDQNVYGAMKRGSGGREPRGDAGSAARFFYSAKASAADRAGSKHPTVKPVALMRWLVRMVTPPGGTVLDLFAGSGTTGQAARDEGFDCILIEREAEYAADIRRRLGLSEAPVVSRAGA